jgi:hypothetical protein
MNEILEKITLIIETYESGKFINRDDLVVMNRQLSCNIYYLTKYNVDSFYKYNSIKHNEKTSVAKAEIKANELVPELRMTRKILEAARGVSIAMNNELSIMKRD